MSCSHCRMNCTHSSCKTKPSCTTYCSALLPTLCYRWLRIQNIWEQRSASSASCTRGDRTCFFILTSTCVIPGGGLASDHTHWIHPRYSFFLPVKVLSKVFRGKFVDGLQRARRRGRLIFAGSIERMADPKCFAAFLRTLFRQDWVVYAKPAFGGPEQVLRYLGRYTHRIAISNHRLVAFDGRNVTFRWRDYARGNKQRLMTVSADEFIRRFLVHVLPKAFVRIRHFGFMANYQRSSSLELCRQRLGMAPIIRSTEISLIGPCWTCPKCGGTMTVVERLTAAQMMWRFVSKWFSDTS